MLSITLGRPEALVHQWTNGKTSSSSPQIRIILEALKLKKLSSHMCHHSSKIFLHALMFESSQAIWGLKDSKPPQEISVASPDSVIIHDILSLTSCIASLLLWLNHVSKLHAMLYMRALVY